MTHFILYPSTLTFSPLVTTNLFFFFFLIYISLCFADLWHQFFLFFVFFTRFNNVIEFLYLKATFFSKHSSIHILVAAAKSLQSCPAVRPHRRQPTRLPRPWDSPGKNTGVGCHFLLQCRKVRSESEVTQSCPTLSNPRGCSLPGSSVHGIFQARVLEWGATAFSI